MCVVDLASRSLVLSLWVIVLGDPIGQSSTSKRKFLFCLCEIDQDVRTSCGGLTSTPFK